VAQAAQEFTGFYKSEKYSCNLCCKLVTNRMNPAAEAVGKGREKNEPAADSAVCADKKQRVGKYEGGYAERSEKTERNSGDGLPLR
jgi:hypothetical protein